jgi:peptide/nickel transport system permease protein
MRRFRPFLTMVASVPITLFGLVLITFLIGRVVPVDPVLAVVGDRAPQDVVERTRREMGLDRPLPEQFLRYTGQLLQGDLGRSVMTNNRVVTDIARFFPATLELATVALVIATLVGVPLGVFAAVRQGSWIDQVIRVVCLSGHSIPVFVLALVCLLVFYATLGWAPGPGRQDVLYQDMVPQVTGLLLVDATIARDWESLRDAAAHLALPALVLGAFNMAYIARMTRAFMLESLRGEHIVTARAKGLPAWSVIWRHGFGNILVRLVTVIALTYAGLLEGAVLTETIFSWPGLGQYLTGSLLNADMNAVLGATLVVGLTYLALNLFADLMYRVLDPRVR